MSIVHVVGMYDTVNRISRTVPDFEHCGSTLLKAKETYIICSSEIYPVATQHGMHCGHVTVADQCMMQRGLSQYLEHRRTEFPICSEMQHVVRMQQWSEGTSSNARPLMQMAEGNDKLARP